MSAPAVSICIPAYNQPQMANRALVSIAEQDYRDYEVVLTDDTPDASVSQIAAKFEGVFHLRYFKNRERLGTPANWNEAIRRSEGRYIKMLHHDDWLADKSSLRAFVGLLELKPEADFGFSGAFAFDGAGKLLFEHQPSPDQVDQAWVPDSMFNKPE